MKARTRISRGYLSPCPFCGSNAIVTQGCATGARIQCTAAACGCATPFMDDKKLAMRIWNKRADYSRLNWKLKKVYESLFARVAQYARALREVDARDPEAVGSIIDDLFDFAEYFSDPKTAQLKKH